jgi:excisionase family DNA binding protein
MLEMRIGATVEVTTDQEKEAVHSVQVALSETAVGSEAPAYLVGPDNTRIAIPEPLFRILRQAANLLSRGERITLAPVHKELSTQEAADLLNVSRPHLIKLLDNGTIQHDKTGRNRRVKFGDVVRYMKQRDEERRQRLRNLIRSSEEMGLYDDEELIAKPTR